LTNIFIKLLLINVNKRGKHKDMDNFGDNAHVIIAGATGLVGAALLKQLLSADSISTVTALVRRPLNRQHNKLFEIQHSNLAVTHWDDQKPTPDFGFICLGTTMREAGSEQALAHIDVKLVTQVAQTMKMLGVKRLAVISSYGANVHSFIHYLRCKGRMEQNLLKIVFERLIFVRPGPLIGNRHIPRREEQIAQNVLFALQPFLIGGLINIKPIQADIVAKAMLFSLTKPTHHPSDNYHTLNSRQIHTMLEHYNLASN